MKLSDFARRMVLPSHRILPGLPVALHRGGATALADRMLIAAGLIVLLALCLAVSPTPVEHDSLAPALADSAAPADESTHRSEAAVEADKRAVLAVEVVAGWRIPFSRADEIVESAWRAAARHGVDPLLVLGVIARESSFHHTGNFNQDSGNSAAKVDPSRPHGLMQVAGRWHPEKFPGGVVRPTSTQENIDIGAQILREYLEREGWNVPVALQRYNGNRGDEQRRYSRAVLRFRDRFAAAVASITPGGQKTVSGV